MAEPRVAGMDDFVQASLPQGNSPPLLDARLDQSVSTRPFGQMQKVNGEKHNGGMKFQRLSFPCKLTVRYALVEKEGRRGVHWHRRLETDYATFPTLLSTPILHYISITD